MQVFGFGIGEMLVLGGLVVVVGTVVLVVSAVLIAFAAWRDAGEVQNTWESGG